MAGGTRRAFRCGQRRLSGRKRDFSRCRSERGVRDEGVVTRSGRRNAESLSAPQGTDVGYYVRSSIKREEENQYANRGSRTISGLRNGNQPEKGVIVKARGEGEILRGWGVTRQEVSAAGMAKRL